MKQFTIYFLLVLSVQYVKSYLAPVLSVCSRSDPKLEQCIIDVVDKIRPNVADGNYGDGRSAPKLDPIYLGRMMINNRTGFQLNLFNVTLRGARDFRIKKIQDYIAEKKFNVNVVIPTLDISGQYDMNMNILLLQATGKGNFNLQLNNTLANLKVQWIVTPTEGNNFIRFTIDLKLKFIDAKFNLTGLFNGDRALEEFGNQAINANPHVLLDEVKPAFEKSLGRIFTDISNSVVQGAEESELLPP